MYQPHSPAPWTSDPEGEIAVTLEDGNGEPFCDVYGHSADPLCESNCALLIAAPELLEACQAIAALADDQGQLNLPMVAGMARQAIAKATGEDPPKITPEPWAPNKLQRTPPCPECGRREGGFSLSLVSPGIGYPCRVYGDSPAQAEANGLAILERFRPVPEIVLAERGKELARVLGCEPAEHPDRFETTQGDKTPLGLARTAAGILDGSITPGD